MPDQLWIEWRAKSGDTDDQRKQSIESVLSDEYKDAGYWGRHYSTVRMTLGTTFLAAATALIYQRLDKPDVSVAVLSSALAVIGLLLFGLFSHLTFTEMNKQRKIVNSYRDKLLIGTDKKQLKLFNWWTEYSGGVIVGVFVVVYSLFLYCWLTNRFDAKQHTAAGGTTNTVQLGLEVKVGGSAPVTLQVPVTVTARP